MTFFQLFRINETNYFRRKTAFAEPKIAPSNIFASIDWNYPNRLELPEPTLSQFWSFKIRRTTFTGIKHTIR